MKLRLFIRNIIEESFKEDVKFEPIQNKFALYYLKHKSFSDDIANSHNKQFIGKDGKKYYIEKEVNEDIFKVYDGEKLDERLEKETNFARLPDLNVGTVVFNTTPKDYFTGYKHTQSIRVKSEYRRKGIATAITRFAEQFYEKPYNPTDVLSPEMQEFTKSYLNENFNPKTQLYDIRKKDNKTGNFLIYSTNKSGKREGEYRELYPYPNNRKFREGFYKNGLFEGWFYQWHPNGQIWKMIQMHSGKKNGSVKNFYNNGKIRISGEYRDGKKDGEFKEYDTNNKLVNHVFFKNNEPVSYYIKNREKEKDSNKQFDFDFEK